MANFAGSTAAAATPTATLSPAVIVQQEKGNQQEIEGDENQTQPTQPASPDDANATNTKQARSNFLKSSAYWTLKDNELKRSAFVVVPEEVYENAGAEGSIDDAHDGESCYDKYEDSDAGACTSAGAENNFWSELHEIICINRAVPGSLIRGIERQDNNVMVTMCVRDLHESYTLVVPEEWPRGEYFLLGTDGCKELGVGSLKTIFTLLVDDFAKEYHTDPLPVFDTPALLLLKESTSDLRVSVSLETEEREAKKECQQAMAFVEACTQATPEIPLSFAKADTSLLVWCAVPCTFLSEQTAQAWGIAVDKAIVFELVLTAPFYFTSTVVPQLNVFQSDSAAPVSGSRCSFGLQWFCHNRVERHLKAAGTWPPTSPEFFGQLTALAVAKINTCTRNCMICDKPLVTEMTKPAVCDSQLCLFSHMQFGLGQDLAAEIQHHPEETDLLVMLTCAAALGSDVKRFEPFPSALEVRTNDGTVLSFLSSDGSPDLGKVRDVLAAVPPICDLLQYKDNTSLKKFLYTKNPLAFPLLQWILTSNRSHVAKLPADQHQAALQTPHQFMLMSAPPAREAEFRSLARQKGSFFTFHGSAMSNWHSILRNGLKNYSHTAMMSCGACYGSGIYMGADISTASGYAPQGPAWSNSRFFLHGGDSSYGYNYGNSCVCIAVCEVINAGYKPKPFYVVPKEQHVMTRAFLIYPAGMAVPYTPASVITFKKAGDA
eukprot:TRINITY_DN261_c3_g1_i1.p1 TRINITY_DN261_c3_g1~~TRINITY_DN261_c3_g1_i1.p1  ORF type:complete len:717 (+),score=140.85 TRINITY_DN261_c3_g1_i1:420-2570(+)